MQKVTTLVVTTGMLVTMIAIDASASPNNAIPSIARPSSSISASAADSSLSQIFGLGRNHSPQKSSASTTTTTVATKGGSGGTKGGSSGTKGGSSGTKGGSSGTKAGSSGSGGGTTGTSSSGSGAPTTTTTQVSSTTSTTSTTQPTPTTTTTQPASAPASAYPLGVANSAEPSGYAPPNATAMAGYSEVYSSDFTGSTLPSAWDLYSGQPGGDPGAMFSNSAVTVANGLLNINAIQQGGQWVTGGLCQCNSTNLTYGAYFVRSRMTGAGPTGVELLWPADGNWPPEIDFNETYGTTSSTMATLHYSSSNQQIQHSLSIDMTQWHTWGVIWTPSSITYTVDGAVWATVTNAADIPNTPMYLSLQTQTWCASDWACPTSPQSLQVDWVAEYSPNS